MLPFPGYGREVLSPIPWSAGVSGICQKTVARKTIWTFPSRSSLNWAVLGHIRSINNVYCRLPQKTSSTQFDRDSQEPKVEDGRNVLYILRIQYSIDKLRITPISEIKLSLVETVFSLKISRLSTTSNSLSMASSVSFIIKSKN